MNCYQENKKSSGAKTNPRETLPFLLLATKEAPGSCDCCQLFPESDKNEELCEQQHSEE